MDYDTLLEGCCEMGVRLLRYGAEIHRAEDTIHRLLAAYGLEGEVFAIPNCLIVSIVDPDGREHTRMRRVPLSSIDVDGIERFNALSRRLCAAPPADPREILARCRTEGEAVRPFPLWAQLFGYCYGAFFFTLFFSGGLAEALAGALAGLAAGACVSVMGRLRANFFISTMVSGFALAVTAWLPLAAGLPVNIDSAVAGAIMVLVPGLVFTNFMSNLLTGDIIAGLSTFVRAVLTAVAIALGTGVAVLLCRSLWSVSEQLGQTVDYSPLLYCLFAFIACLGFCPAYNVRTWAAALCCVGGALGWMVYLLAQAWMGNVFLSSLLAAVTVAVYAQIMARVRKCPATSYLVISMFPLVPGLTIYQAMDYGIRGETELFWDTFFRTFGIAGCLAIGLLLVSTAVRVIHHLRVRRVRHG